MKQNKPILHARDHLPGGADPIPGVTGSTGSPAPPPPGTQIPHDGPTTPPTDPRGPDFHWWRFREPGEYIADVPGHANTPDVGTHDSSFNMTFTVTSFTHKSEIEGGHPGPNSQSLAGLRIKTDNEFDAPYNYWAGQASIGHQNWGPGQRFTVMGWYQLLDWGQQDLLHLNETNTVRTYLLSNPDGSLTLHRQGTNFATSPGFAGFAWMYVALVVGGGRIKLYVNPTTEVPGSYSPTWGTAFPLQVPMAMETWGLENGDYTADQLAARLTGAGFKSVSVQLNAEPKPGRTHADYIAQLTTDVATLQAAGIQVVGWGAVDSSTGADLTATGVNGWMPQVEGPDQYTALISALGSEVGSGLPKAVVWTEGGINSSSQVSTLNAAGIGGYAVESYAAAGETFSHVDRLLWQGTQFGMTPAQSIPMIGTYRGETSGDYTGLDETVIPNYGIYNTAQTSDAGWADFTSINSGAALSVKPEIDEPDPATVSNPLGGILTIGSSNSPALGVDGQGNYGADGSFEGSISELALYHYALSGAQIRQHYLSGLYGDTGTVPPQANIPAGGISPGQIAPGQPGQHLVTTPGGGTAWVADTGGGASTLDGLTDVDTTGAVDNDVLSYDAATSSWEATAGTPGPAGPTGPAGPGVPTGGTTGQVLSKTAGTDYATAWQTPTAAGGDPSTDTLVWMPLFDSDGAVVLDSDEGLIPTLIPI